MICIWLTAVRTTATAMAIRVPKAMMRRVETLRFWNMMFTF
jgi:hypothetical protein